MRIELRYGLNPNQVPASAVLEGAPLEVLNGAPGYINLLDALTAWQLVRELKQVTGKPAAAAYKHVSPAGAALAAPLSELDCAMHMVPVAEDYSPIATAYIRARGGDRLSAFGDAAAVSEPVDESLARVLSREVSDLLIAPDFEPAALDLLRKKKQGKYLLLKIDPDYVPPESETRDVFGVRLTQLRNTAVVDHAALQNVVTRQREIPPAVAETLLLAAATLKYTQSNSICIAYAGQVIGIGAGQQSRIHCTRLAGQKARKWLLQRHPHVRALPLRSDLSRTDRAIAIDQFLLADELSPKEGQLLRTQLTTDAAPLDRAKRDTWMREFDGLCLGSDAFIPFRDNVDAAAQLNVQYIIQTGGSLRDADVTAAADEYDQVMVHTHVRSFLH